MLAVRYHRQLARSIYVWGVFTPGDFGALILALAANMVVIGSDLAMVLILAGFPVYLILLRLGRSPGYDVHLWQSFFRARVLRPGRAELRPWRLPS